MKWLVGMAIACTIGCKKSATQGTGAGSAGSNAAGSGGSAGTAGSGSAAGSGGSAVDAAGSAAAASGDAGMPDAKGPLVDLLKVVPTTIRVSSQVRNPKILPVHIVDRDLNSAWNSVTGELAGAWVQIEVPVGSYVDHVKLTVGHTGKGPKKEDYFTMNPRISRVAILATGKSPLSVELDPEKRELQAVPVERATTTVRVLVQQFKPGTKKAWREIAISELEVWGTPPVGTAAPATALVPKVLVGEAVAETLETDPCGGLAELKQEREDSRRAAEEECNTRDTQEERDQCNVDPPGDPDCSVSNVEIEGLKEPWAGASLVCEVYDNVYGPTDCSIVVRTKDDAKTAVSVSIDGSRGDLETEAEISNIIPGEPNALVIRYQRSDETDSLYWVACRATPKLACSQSLWLEGHGYKGYITFNKAGELHISGNAPPQMGGKQELVFK